MSISKVYYVSTHTNGNLKFLSKNQYENSPWKLKASSAMEAFDQANLSITAFKKWKFEIGPRLQRATATRRLKNFQNNTNYNRNNDYKDNYDFP
jgi:hypothetical protein